MCKTFLGGHGLVWNPGERVEGYSTFLWVLFISLLGYFRIDLVLASRILGIAFAFATLLLFYTSDKKNPLGAHYCWQPTAVLPCGP